jgi:hypothetical protein
MDTLCIPVADEHMSLSEKGRYKSLRKKSIQMMRQIYHRAEAVLVFDADLQRLTLNSTVYDNAMAIYLSNWLHRLWTFQEGMLAKQLIFQLEDGPLAADAFTDESVQEAEAAEENGLYGSFQFDARSAAMGHFVILRDFVEERLSSPAGNLPSLAHAIQQRTTSRISDEAICAATILDMDMTDILAVERTDVQDEALAETRMKIFFKQLGGFTPGIIFHQQKHMSSVGYRWAPKSLLGARPGDFNRDIEAEHASFDGEGLNVRYPGFILDKVQQVPGSGTDVEVMTKHDKRYYRLQLFPEDNGEQLWAKGAAYAVVMFRSVSEPESMGTDAIIGMLRDPGFPDNMTDFGRNHGRTARVIEIRCECRAWIEPLESPSRGGALGAQVFDKKKWRIF